MFRTVLLFLVSLFLAFSPVQTCRAEENPKLYPVLCWTISNVQSLAGLQPLIQENTPLNVSLPAEILALDGISGMTVTDGEMIWPILAMTPRQRGLGEKGFTEERFNDDDFRKRLGQNSIVQFMFPLGRMKITLRENTLYVLHPYFPVEWLDEVAPEKRWKPLREKYDAAFSHDHPERILYPGELPAQQEDEGRFLRELRKNRSKKNYKDDGVESTLFGLQWDTDARRFTYAIQSTAAEDASQAEERIAISHRSEPFGVGGFLPDENVEPPLVAGQWRFFSDSKRSFIIKAGASVIPIEERKQDGRKSMFILAPAIATSVKSLESLTEEHDGKYEIIQNGNVFFLTPVVADVPDDHEDAEAHREVKYVNQAIKGLQWRCVKILQPISDFLADREPGSVEDHAFAFHADEGIIIAAMSAPMKGKTLDFHWMKELADCVSGISDVWKFLNEDAKPFSFDCSFSDVRTVDGVVYRLGKIDLSHEGETKCLVPFLLAQGDDMIAVLFSTRIFEAYFQTDGNYDFAGIVVPDAEEFSGQYIGDFVQRIEKSRRLKAEGLAAPTNRVTYNFQGHRGVFEESIQGRTQTYSVRLDQWSIGWVAMFAPMLNENLHRMLPF